MPEQSEPTKRAVAYVRESTEEQGRRLLTRRAAPSHRTLRHRTTGCCSSPRSTSTSRPDALPTSAPRLPAPDRGRDGASPSTAS